ncbi:hypothetical protein RSK20926_22469 [Roseobacter sp. SK209-2-6]|nr:hypothetical protein RSK20926_22469 [Roseobacter sp. SK209-2-6]
MAHVPCRFLRDHILRQRQAKGYFRKFANRLHMIDANMQISKQSAWMHIALFCPA